jgi:hypothetical protein
LVVDDVGGFSSGSNPLGIEDDPRGPFGAALAHSSDSLLLAARHSSP